MNYIEAQSKWMTDNKIVPGSKVKVLRAAHQDELGWDNSWINRMEATIGKIITVQSCSYSGIKMEPNEHCDIPVSYPYFVLEPVNENA